MNFYKLSTGVLTITIFSFVAAWQTEVIDVNINNSQQTEIIAEADISLPEVKLNYEINPRKYYRGGNDHDFDEMVYDALDTEYSSREYIAKVRTIALQLETFEVYKDIVSQENAEGMAKKKLSLLLEKNILVKQYEQRIDEYGVSFIEMAGLLAQQGEWDMELEFGESFSLGGEHFDRLIKYSEIGDEKYCELDKRYAKTLWNRHFVGIDCKVLHGNTSREYLSGEKAVPTYELTLVDLSV